MDMQMKGRIESASPGLSYMTFFTRCSTCKIQWPTNKDFEGVKTNLAS